MTTSFKCTTAQLITPEFIRLLAKAQLKENRKQWLIGLLCHALRICGKLKPSPTRARHSQRLFIALNKARAV
jgi:hypothetical protein